VETLTKALDLAGGSKNFDLIAEILLKIGNAFSHSDPSLSLQYYEKALENANQHDGSEIMMHILTGMGEAWQDSGVPDRALEFYEKANAVAQKIGKPVPMCRILSNKAKAMSMLNDYDEAKKWAVQAKNIADQHHLIVCQRDINLLLSQIFSKTGNFKEATVFLGNYMTFNDSINNSSNTKKMAELEYQYKYEKEIKAIEFELQQKEAVLEARNKQSLIVNITLGSILLTILIFAFIMVRIYIKKRKTHQLILLQSQEITEANTALEEISSTKDRFFTIIAHDLRGAFNSILGFSNLLRTDAGGDDQNDLSMLIRESAENAYKLLNNLLAWSMANVGLMPFKPVSIRLLSFVEQNKVGWSSRASNKNISVVYNIPENFEIVADADMINTIIRNLVNNSVKYTPRGGQISIGATTTAGGAILTISDNGVGMTPEVLGNLFKINKKMSMPGTEKEMGSGLGLLICKEFAATHKGSIWAESEPGKGSRFNVFIPSADN
jgi:signal transduction histidine kinase